MKNYVNSTLQYLALSDEYFIDNFKVSEFGCNDGAQLLIIDFKVLCLLFAIRSHYGKPVNINSAFRTHKYNKLIGGATDSAHLYGYACDFNVKDVNILDLVKFINNSCNCRIGVYDNFIHIDFMNYYKNISSLFWIMKKEFKTPLYFSDFYYFYKKLKKEFNYGK